MAKLTDCLKKFIGYYRVSTDKQGKSRLGLEGQIAAVEAYCAAQGGVLVKVYEEVETGKIADRPELIKALSHARRIKATLIFAKLDRLARNARFLLGIVESGADVIFCDFPTIPEGAVGKFMLTQMAAVAELEAGLIGQRTKAALGAFVEGKRVPKRVVEMYPEGVPAEVVEQTAGKLGAARHNGYRFTGGRNMKGALSGGAATGAKAAEAYTDLAPIVAELRDLGLSLRQIAARLDEEGHTTRTGKPWNPVQVNRVLARAS